MMSVLIAARYLGIEMQASDIQQLLSELHTSHMYICPSPPAHTHRKVWWATNYNKAKGRSAWLGWNRWKERGETESTRSGGDTRGGSKKVRNGRRED